MPGPCLHEIAANPEVDDQCHKHGNMTAKAHGRDAFQSTEYRIGRETRTPDHDLALISQPASTIEKLRALTLAEVDEVAGELHRRIRAALRQLGEQGADQPGPLSAGPKGARTARWLVSGLVASLELAAVTLTAAAGQQPLQLPRVDRYTSTIAAVMYAAPTLPAMLQRLEQDRRLAISLARELEARLDDGLVTPWGPLTARDLVLQVLILDSAQCAQVLERRAAEPDGTEPGSTGTKGVAPPGG